MTQSLAKASGQFSETEIDDEVVVMSLESGDFFSLTGTAIEIWQLIDGTRDREAVIAELTAHYPDAASDIAADVDRFLRQLGDAGILAQA